MKINSYSFLFTPALNDRVLGPTGACKNETNKSKFATENQSRCRNDATPRQCTVTAIRQTDIMITIPLVLPREKCNKEKMNQGLPFDIPADLNRKNLKYKSVLYE